MGEEKVAAVALGWEVGRCVASTGRLPSLEDGGGGGGRGFTLLYLSEIGPWMPDVASVDFKYDLKK